MDKFEILRTKEGDLSRIASFTGPECKTTTLAWLLKDNREPGFRSFIAMQSGVMVGHIGYTVSGFSFKQHKFRGVHPILWKVDTQCQGQGIGKGLMESVFAEGDFSFMIGGSDDTKRIAPFLKYREKFLISSFVRVINPLKFASTVKDKKIKGLIKAFLFYCKSGNTSLSGKNPTDDIGIVQINAVEGIHDLGNDVNIYHLLDTQTAGWVWRCPEMKVSVLKIKDAVRILGYAVCFIKTHKSGHCTGRIVHITDLGSETGVWKSAIHQIEQFLIGEGCAAITALGTLPAEKDAFKELGFFRKNRYPFWLRDPKTILPSALWHVTFLDGDVSYRGI
jgi:hypothetical protein